MPDPKALKLLLPTPKKMPARTRTRSADGDEETKRFRLQPYAGAYKVEVEEGVSPPTVMGVTED